jgi:hypothetical protein
LVSGVDIERRRGIRGDIGNRRYIVHGTEDGIQVERVFGMV